MILLGQFEDEEGVVPRVIVYLVLENMVEVEHPMSFFSQSGFPLLTSFVINESDSISYDIFHRENFKQL